MNGLRLVLVFWLILNYQRFVHHLFVRHKRWHFNWFDEQWFEFKLESIFFLLSFLLAHFETTNFPFEWSAPDILKRIHKTFDSIQFGNDLKEIWILKWNELKVVFIIACGMPEYWILNIVIIMYKYPSMKTCRWSVFFLLLFLLWLLLYFLSLTEFL